MPSRGKSPEADLARLRQSRDEVRAAIRSRIASGEALLAMPVRDKPELDELRALSYTWSDGNKALLQHAFTNSSLADEYAGEFLFGAIGGTFDLGEEEADAKSWIKQKLRRLEGVVEQIQFMDEPLGTVARTPTPHQVTNPTAVVERLRRFDRFARGLRERHAARTTLDVADEYDVQDLVRAILALDFEDVRPEEWAPSYAGGASRVDFLLKAEQLVVEVKMTREGLTDRQLGAELVIDIARYRAHPDCKALVCLVFDPEHRIRNPAGLIRDLEALGNPPMVRVFITPS